MSIPEKFDRRTEVYRSEFSFLKTYKTAQKMVAETNHEMAAVYQADETPPSIGDVMAAAKKATGASKVRLDVAVMRILEGERAVSQRIAGDWLDHMALVQINNLNLGSSQIRPIQSL